MIHQALAMISQSVFPPRSNRHFMKTTALHILRSLCVTEGVWLILHCCVKHVYSWVPHFSSAKCRPHPSWSELLQAWACLMIPIRVWSATNEARELQTLTLSFGWLYVFYSSFPGGASAPPDTPIESACRPPRLIDLYDTIPFVQVCMHTCTKGAVETVMLLLQRSPLYTYAYILVQRA